jgi:hypothetical protein
MGKGFVEANKVLRLKGNNVAFLRLWSNHAQLPVIKRCSPEHQVRRAPASFGRLIFAKIWGK